MCVYAYTRIYIYSMYMYILTESPQNWFKCLKSALSLRQVLPGSLKCVCVMEGFPHSSCSLSPAHTLAPAVHASFRLSTEFKRHSRLRGRLHAPCVASPLLRAH